MKNVEYSNVAGEDILCIRLSESSIDHTEERGRLLVDIDALGNPVGVEILDVTELIDLLRSGTAKSAVIV